MVRVERLQQAGAQVLTCPDEGPRVNLGTLMERLAERNCINLLVEGGGTLLGAFVDSGLVDKVLAFIAPVVLGGRDAVPAVAGRGAARVEEALRLEQVTLRRFGEDLLVKGYARRPELG